MDELAQRIGGRADWHTHRFGPLVDTRAPGSAAIAGEAAIGGIEHRDRGDQPIAGSVRFAFDRHPRGAEARAAAERPGGDAVDAASRSLPWKSSERPTIDARLTPSTQRTMPFSSVSKRKSSARSGARNGRRPGFLAIAPKGIDPRHDFGDLERTLRRRPGRRHPPRPSSGSQRLAADRGRDPSVAVVHDLEEAARSRFRVRNRSGGDYPRTSSLGSGTARKPVSAACGSLSRSTKSTGPKLSSARWTTGPDRGDCAARRALPAQARGAAGSIRTRGQPGAAQHRKRDRRSRRARTAGPGAPADWRIRARGRWRRAPARHLAHGSRAASSSRGWRRHAAAADQIDQLPPRRLDAVRRVQIGREHRLQSVVEAHALSCPRRRNGTRNDSLTPPWASETAHFGTSQCGTIALRRNIIIV
jgi:hypothetical protein